MVPSSSARTAQRTRPWWATVPLPRDPTDSLFGVVADDQQLGRTDADVDPLLAGPLAQRLGGGPTGWAAQFRGWRHRRARPLDLLLALLVAVAAVGSGLSPVVTRPVWQAPIAVAVALGLVASLPLAWRRRAPAAVLLAVSLAGLAGGATGQDLTLSVLIATYTAGTLLPRQRSLGLLALVLGLVAVDVALRPQALPGLAFVRIAACFAFAWAIGFNVRLRRAYRAHLHQRGVEVLAEHQREAQRTIVQERGRIARELHDVVAHSVSVMVVQAGAARRVVENSPTDALEALTQIEQSGREALRELRVLLGVLRPSESGPAAAAPQPGVADLEALCESVSRAGLPTRLVVEGARRCLERGPDLSVYRIVQEALTNCLKHAGPASAAVLLDFGAHALRLRVDDDGRGPQVGAVASAGGHGLVNMRERVALYGGTLRTGQCPGGGFRVEAVLPLPPR